MDSERERMTTCLVKTLFGSKIFAAVIKLKRGHTGLGRAQIQRGASFPGGHGNTRARPHTHAPRGTCAGKRQLREDRDRNCHDVSTDQGGHNQETAVFFPGASRGSRALPTPRFPTCSLQHCERRNRRLFRKP